MTSLWKGVANVVRQVAKRAAAPAPTQATTRPTPPAPRPVPTDRLGGRYLEYAPQLDGDADPGEIVWTYVQYY